MRIPSLIAKHFQPLGRTDPDGPLTRDEALAMLRSGEARVMLRVEGRDGKPGSRLGAYSTSACTRLLYNPLGVSDYELRESHPTPVNDAGLSGVWLRICDEEDHRQYLFGFDKFSQYKNWFFVEDALKDEEEYSVLGVYITSREFSHVGQFQMIAHKQEMIHLMDLPLTYQMDSTLSELFDAQERV